MIDLATELRLVAKNIEGEGYDGWRNDCLRAAAEIERLSKRPDAWSVDTAHAFWTSWEENFVGGKHGHSESTYAAIVAAMKAQGLWKP